MKVEKISSFFIWSTTFVVPFLKIFVCFKVIFSELDFSLCVFYNNILKTNFSLLNILHNFSYQLLKHLSHRFRRVNWNFIVFTFLRVLKSFYLLSKVFIILWRVIIFFLNFDVLWRLSSITISLRSALIKSSSKSEFIFLRFEPKIPYRTLEVRNWSAAYFWGESVFLSLKLPIRIISTW